VSGGVRQQRAKPLAMFINGCEPQLQCSEKSIRIQTSVSLRVQRLPAAPAG
jgi:hypothetical protein